MGSLGERVANTCFHNQLLYNVMLYHQQVVIKLPSDLQHSLYMYSIYVLRLTCAPLKLSIRKQINSPDKSHALG